MPNSTGDPVDTDAVDGRRGFFRHLLTYLTMTVFLLAINLLTDPGSLWFYWLPLVWGVGLAMHAISVFAMDRRLSDRFSVSRPATAEPAAETGEPMSTSEQGELEEIMDRAAALIDRMRVSARQIPTVDPRREALDACAASDRVLSAIADHPDELPLARDFADRFLQPASAVIGDYARLANRNVPSARATLEAVETHDLPLITRKADELYDRLHRGTLIDLQVAREMLTLDMADVSLPEPDTQRPT